MHVLTENEVRELAARMESGGRFSIPPGALLTPLARDYLRGRRIEIVEPPAAGTPASGSRRKPQDSAAAQRAQGAPTPAEADDALVDAVAAEVVRALGAAARTDGRGDEKAGVGPASVPVESRAAGPASVPAEAVGRGLPDLRAESHRSAGAGASSRAVVWAIGGDRPGILAAVSELLGGHKINILEISQTILSGVFAMVMIVDLSDTGRAFGELKSDLEKLGVALGITVSAQRDDIFQYMHRI